MPDGRPLLAADLADRLARQRAACGPPATARARASALTRLDRALGRFADPLAQAIDADFGARSRVETLSAEIIPLRTACRHARAHLAAWMRPERRAVSLAFRPATNVVDYVPLGVIGIVAPWNYPVFLTVGPLIDALAAGNRAMIKPSELTPRTAATLREMLATCFDTDEVAVIEGDVDTARAFCALPFDHLVFTGSTAIGREVAAAAAANLVPVTLELGGKSPVILGEDADPAAAARSVMRGKLFNAGQTCVAPDYVFAPRATARRFADAALAAAEAMLPTLAGNPDLTATITERHAARLRALLDGLPASTIVLRHHAGDSGRHVAPTIVLDPPADHPLLREEIFGPILPVIGTDTLAGAIAQVRARPRPLALYVYGSEARTVRPVLAATLSGGVSVNTTMMHCAQPDLPFGGIGPSGTGAYHGREGFLRFSHARAAHRRGVFSGFEWTAPPYGRATRIMLRLLGR